ncbi:uncharacterized protein EDB93DRAFT_1108423 [Suillus bovinus]|uniref:uncharacterized protein n=1 Tax=Suillus bovinus TaxID=48563 RepID=UPI001B87D2F9|nr:uncharacterized protein EDB93DRAFT_1108423 [Suillus bovinus]KAG2130435.1 hypothetical protein EDB93DRAFT_1108423 [Suillus bovinus]
MSSSDKFNNGPAKKEFDHELFDIYWDVQNDQYTTCAGTPAFTLAKVNTTCVGMTDQVAAVESAAIPEPTTVETIDVMVPSTKSDFDMCWGDLPSGGHGGMDGLTTVRTLDSGNQATIKLEHINVLMGDDLGEASVEILHANSGLIGKYKHACDRFITASKDVAKIEHLMQMFRQIDDPLVVLELASVYFFGFCRILVPSALASLLLVPFAGTSVTRPATGLLAFVFTSDQS